MRTLWLPDSLQTTIYWMGTALCAVLLAAPVANADYASGFDRSFGDRTSPSF